MYKAQIEHAWSTKSTAMILSDCHFPLYTTLWSRNVIEGNSIREAV